MVRLLNKDELSQRCNVLSDCLRKVQDGTSVYCSVVLLEELIKLIKVIYLNFLFSLLGSNSVKASNC